MVGFAYDPNTNVKQGEDLKKPALDPLDTCLPELDNLSFPFASEPDIDFDCIKDWIDLNPDYYMADLNPVKEAIVQQGSVGKLGDLIEEELGKVSLEGGLDGSTVGVKSDKMETVECGDESECEVVGGVKSDGIATVGCGDGSKSEMMGGLNSNEVEVKSGDTLSVGMNGAKSDEDETQSSDSESESENESGSSSDSSSSSSTSDDDDDDDDGGEEGGKKGSEVEEEEKGEIEKETDVEEGEIRDSIEEEMVTWSGEDEEEGDSVKAGPILSKNEVKVLPPVPEVNVTLQPHHQTLPVGFVLSIVGAQVIVEGVEKHNPLNEGSILWITESRSPLGLVDEIFGPVKNPYYIVRYNSDSEVPSGIQLGTLISFVPEFVNHVLNNNNLYKKGYDASGENDEELSDEMEFSDDEKEAEYKRMLKMSKRGTNEENVGNRKKNKNKNKNRAGNWRNDQPSATESSSAGTGLSPREHNHRFNPPVTASQDHGNCSRAGPSGPVQGFTGGPGSGSNLVPTYAPQQSQAPGFPGPSNGVWTNGVPCQQPQNMGFPNGLPMQWVQQNHPQQLYQMPFPNGVPIQPQFGAGPRLPFNFVSLGGQSNFGAGPGFGPSWPSCMNQGGFNQPQGGMILQGPHAPTPSMNVGENGLQPSHVNQSGFNQPQASMGFHGLHAPPPSMNQSGFNQSQASMGMQGPHAPTPSMNVGEHGLQPSRVNQNGFNQSQAGMGLQGAQATPQSVNVGYNGLQSPQGSQGNTKASQNFNRGAHSGHGRRAFRRGGGGRSGGGRGRHQSK